MDARGGMGFSAGYKSVMLGEKGVVRVYIKVRPDGAPSVRLEQGDRTGMVQVQKWVCSKHAASGCAAAAVLPLQPGAAASMQAAGGCAWPLPQPASTHAVRQGKPLRAWWCPAQCGGRAPVHAPRRAAAAFQLELHEESPQSLAPSTMRWRGSSSWHSTCLKPASAMASSRG